MKKAIIKSMADVHAVDVEWLWKPYLPRGTVSCGEDAAGHAYLCVTGKSSSQWQTIADHALLYRTAGTGSEA